MKKSREKERREDDEPRKRKVSALNWEEITYDKDLCLCWLQKCLQIPVRDFQKLDQQTH